MPTNVKRKPTSHKFSPKEIAAATTAAPEAALGDGVDWGRAQVTQGGGVKATIGALRRMRGPNKNPTKEQVAIRFSRKVLAYFRATGPGWQTRMDEVLQKYVDRDRGE
jgi:uncharacterized protein (DUF4415 family)